MTVNTGEGADFCYFKYSQLLCKLPAALNTFQAVSLYGDKTIRGFAMFLYLHTLQKATS